MRTIVAVALAAFVSLGCSNTLSIRRPLSERALTEVNGMVEGRSARVAVTGGPSHPPEGKDVVVGRDRTVWLELANRTTPFGFEKAKEDWRPTSAPTEAVQQISVTRAGRGAAEGLGLGVVVGLGAGAIGAGIAANSGGRGGTGVQAVAALGMLVAGPVLGMLVGSLIGAGVGHRTTIKLGDRLDLIR